jgi:hypothetical protein
MPFTLGEPTPSPESLGTCPVCYTELNIHGITPSDTSSSAQALGVALPCTHMLCRDCYHGIFEAAEDGALLCPLCKVDSAGKVCGHSAYFLVWAEGKDDPFEGCMEPISLAEGGGSAGLLL